MTLLLLSITLSTIIQTFGQSDADTYIQVEKARVEVPSCRKLLDDSMATGSIPLNFLTYRELDQKAEQLMHCGFVFRITGDSTRGDDAGNESDRYDAAISSHMKRYLKAKKLWNDFLKQDCRLSSTTCATK